MKVKDLSISSNVYIAYDEKIKPVKIRSIEQRGENVELSINDYSFISISPNDETFEFNGDTFFLNFEQAQKEQERLRKKEIEKNFRYMSEAITNYNAVILKYFNKPLSTLEEL